MAWLPDGQKHFEDIFIRFGETHERDGQTDRQTDGQTDGQTPGDGIISCLCITSRGKKCNISGGEYRIDTKF